MSIIKANLFFRKGGIILLIYIIEEKRGIFDLLRSMIKKSGKYIFLYGDAEFSGDIKKYIDNNEVLVFKAVSPDSCINTEEKVDLAVFGDLKSGAVNINFKTVKTFLLNIENINKLKNIDFGASQTITCGLHEKDTVIFSSIDADERSVMLELQRSIINIKGGGVEPFEKKIALECGIGSEGTGDALFALAALMYCGRLE